MCLAIDIGNKYAKFGEDIIKSYTLEEARKEIMSSKTRRLRHMRNLRILDFAHSDVRHHNCDRNRPPTAERERRAASHFDTTSFYVDSIVAWPKPSSVAKLLPFGV